MTTGRPDPSAESLRDPRFDAAWRAASREEPPAALDAAILAAAHRAVGAGPQPVAVPEATRPERWWWPLAAAASIGAVAVGILQITASDRAGVADPVRAIVSDMPAERSQAKPPAAPGAPAFVPAPTSKLESAAPSAASGGNAATQDEAAGSRRETRDAPPQNAPDTPRPGARTPDAGMRTPPAGAATDARAPARQMRAPSPEADAGVAAKAIAPGAATATPAAPAAATAPMPVAPPAPPASIDAAAPARAAQPFPAGGATPPRMESESARPAALGKVMTAPAAGARADERARDRAPLPVADWLALIRKLRAEGRTEELNREVAAFRAAHPEAQQQLAEALAGDAPPAAPAR